MARTDSETPSISLDALELFMAIVRTGTISIAARELGMDPSVASRKIATLEGAFKAKLFERTTRRIHLTEAGAAALEWARDVIHGYEHVADGLAAMRDSPSGAIRLVMNEYIGTVLLPPFLAGFSQRYPQIHYVLSLTDELVDPDERGYDIAVHSGRVPDSGLVGVRIVEVQRILCASPAYLARRGTPTELADLAMHDCLAHRQAAGNAWHFRRGDRMIRQPINQLVLADGYMALLEFARQGLGIVRVSSSAVRDDLLAGRLVQVLPQFRSVYADGELPAIWILYPNRSLLQRHRIFVDELTAYLKQTIVEFARAESAGRARAPAIASRQLRAR